MTVGGGAFDAPQLPFVTPAQGVEGAAPYGFFLDKSDFRSENRKNGALRRGPLEQAMLVPAWFSWVAGIRFRPGC